MAGSIFLILLAALHFDVVFLGRSLVLTNHSNPFDWRPLPQNYGENFVPHDLWSRRNLWPYANIRDPGGSWWQWEPSGEFLRRAFEVGEPPFWDPYAGAGAPAMANLTPAFFFPPYTLIVALGNSLWLKNSYFLLLMWAASFFTYMFLRSHGLAFLSSLYGGAIVLMSGSLNQHVGTITGQTAACLPFTLYVTRLFLDGPTARRIAALALSYGGVALASFPPVLWGIFSLATLYVLVSLGVEFRGIALRARVGTRWVVAVLLSLGLVSFWYLPAIALWSTSPPHVQAVYVGAGLETIPFIRLYQLLSPTLMGGVQVYVTPAIPHDMTVGPHFPYVGIVAVISACFSGFGGTRRTRSLFIFGVVSATLMLLKLLGVAPVQWVGRLPILEYVHFAYYLGIPLGFVLAFLAASGFENFFLRAMTARRALSVGALAVFAIANLWWLARDLGALSSPSADYWLRDWRVTAVVTVVAVSVVVLNIYGLTRVPAGRLAGISFLVLVIGEGVFNNAYPNPKAWNVFDHPVPYMKVVQHGAGSNRVMAFGAPSANLNSAYEVFSMDSLMSFNPPRTFELYKKYTDCPPWLFMREAKRLPPELVLDRANVAVVSVLDVLADVVEAARTRQYKPLFSDGYVSVFERRTLPRFFFSSEYPVVPSSTALELVAKAPPRELILESQPGIPFTPNQQGDPAVSVDVYRRNSTALQITAPRPGLVYASEAFFEGWRAFVNGSETAVLPANYAFRAVAVPAGHSRIEFKYWPPGLTAGLRLSGGAFVLLLCLFVVERRPTSHSTH